MSEREGEDVRRVVLRNLDSEWTPVRYKPKPSYPGRRIDNRQNPSSTKWLEVWNPEKDCVTFFFTNFPVTCNLSSLRNRFNEIATVKDLFIPYRRDKKGKPFGFVRFSGNINTPQVEGSLNNTWFGSYKLRANISKFARKEATKHRNVKRGSAEGSMGIGTLGAARVESKSYLQAVCAKAERKSDQEQPIDDSNKFVGITYKSSEEDRELLSRCFTGQLKLEFNWPDVHADIQQASEGRFHIKYRGGDLVFLHPFEDKDINRADLETINKWFEFLEPWCEKDIHNIRLVWTSWYGIPMHAWNKNFFRLVSLKFGKMIKIDESTLEKLNVHRARILIRTSTPEITRGAFPVWVDERKYFIRVREEEEWEENSMSDWSEEGTSDSEDENFDRWNSEDESEDDPESFGTTPVKKILDDS
ncbi:hypothetical protein ACS0TY_017171 [Phlomoides rotata]